MLKLNRLTNFDLVRESGTGHPPRFDVFYVNEDHIRWVEFFTLTYGHPLPQQCHLARLLMAPSGELIVSEDGELGIALRKITIKAS